MFPLDSVRTPFTLEYPMPLFPRHPLLLLRTVAVGLAASLAASLATGPATAGPAAAATGNVDLPRYPSISPDGTQVVFTWRGDLWLVPTRGGLAARLTSHPAGDLHSVWSSDGRHIAFSSDRSGFLNVYRMDSDGRHIRHVTDIDRPCIPTGFASLDAGEPVVLFHAVLEGDVYREFRPYRVSSDGGPLRRIHDAFGAQPVVSPDGTRVAFVRGGYYDRNESRRHYRGAEASDVWLFDRTDASFTRLTAWRGNDRTPRWGGARTLLYLSDRELDCVNLYRMSAADGERTSARLTSFTTRDVQHLDVAADGRTAVLSVWDTLYALDLDNPAATPVPIAIRANEDERDDYELKDIATLVSEAALSPDGTVMAVIAYGEIYVRHVDEGSPTRRVTYGHAREKDLAWSPDGLRLYFTSDRDGTESIFAATVAKTRSELKEQFTEQTGIETAIALAGEDDEDDDEDDDDDEGADEASPDEEDLPPELQPDRWHDALTFTIEPVVQRRQNDRMPSPSPDGRSLAFRGVRGDLHVKDLQTGNGDAEALRTVTSGWDAGITWRWSPDGRFLAYAVSNLDFNRDIFMVPVDGSAPPVNLTRHPDDEDSPRFSADGRILSFISERINDQRDVWTVYLDKALEALTPHELQTYYDRAAKVATKRTPLEVPPPHEVADDADAEDEGADDAPDEGLPPVVLSLEDAYLRVKRITRLADGEDDLEITPGGDRLIFTSSGDEPGLYTVKWDGTERTRLGDRADVRQVSLTGDRIVVVAEGRAAIVALEGGERTVVDVSGRLRIDLEEQSSQKFLEAARGLGEQYYHPTMNDLDWPALTADYHGLARKARTAEEFNWVANRLIGELNGSHLRIVASDPPAPNRQTYGRLGLTHRRVDAGVEVVSVVPRGPAAAGPMAFRPGDLIRAVEGRPFSPTDTLESVLKGRVGEETMFSVARRLEDGSRMDLDLLLTPIGYRAEAQLEYEAWRSRNADLVREKSGGRIGYIHIQGMSQPALDVFERDLFAAAEGMDGLLIDVRNNGGGWTTDRVLASIMVQPHAYTIPRGADPAAVGHYPQPRLFIQRYTLPMNLLCNEKSYSNAEIMSHAFKTLKRGTLVGQQTHGSVISTGGWPLIDGTWVRLPFRGWYLTDGTNMELNGAMPDLLVPQTPEAESRGEDEQLTAAVEDLLQRLDRN